MQDEALGLETQVELVESAGSACASTFVRGNQHHSPGHLHGGATAFLEILTSKGASLRIRGHSG